MKRAVLGVVALCATFALTDSRAFAQEDVAALERGRAWYERTTQRWEAILRVAVAAVSRPSLTWPARTEELRADRRVRIAAMRSELDQTVATLRADIEQAGRAPNLFALARAQDRWAQAALDEVPNDQRIALGRLNAMTALVEETQLAALNGEVERSIASRIVMYAEIREMNWITAEMSKSWTLPFARGSFPDLYWRLFGLDQRAEVVDYDVRIAILGGRREEETAQARARMDQIVNELRAVAPLLQSATIGSREIVSPPLIPQHDPERVARMRAKVPALPAAILRHAERLQNYASSWNTWTAETVAAESERTFPSLMTHLADVLDEPPPPL
jgi:hypothetical protein